ncbi:hypothetical protein PFISCL1PPCAC_8712, partial [Pristionchus fissidentatus]
RYLSNGNLKQYLMRSCLQPSEYLPIAQKISSAMAYISQQRIVHRDLAARNILVGETIDTIKICDFGFARRLEANCDCFVTDQVYFPNKWAAPEAFVFVGGPLEPQLKAEGRFTHASDVWSFAIVLWELYSNGEGEEESLSISHTL